MRSNWIDAVKATPLDKLAPAVGLTLGRLGSFGPCPACSEAHRGSDDRRGACGWASDRRGWDCKRCKVKGDAVDLLALVHLGARSSALTKPQWGDLRDWCVDQGWATAADTTAAPKTRSTATLTQRLLGADRPRRERSAPSTPDTQQTAPAATQGSGGPFAWREGLAEECAADMWDTGSPQSDAALVWLREVRLLTDATAKAWGLGVIVIHGAPWLTIPLQDEAERVVNIRFRSLPPQAKTYRVCPGRPLPLFGSHRLGNDLGRVIVTEGELDVMALWQYGLTSSVVSGTAGSDTMKGEWLDQLEAYNGFALCYDNDEAGERGATKFAAKMGVERCSRAVLPSKDAGQCLMDGVTAESVHRVLDRAQPMFGVGFNRVSNYTDEIEQLINNPESLMGRTTGSSKLDACLGGLRPGLIVMSGDTGHGKAQPVDEPVLTPDGWKPIGALRVGDKVIAVDGRPTKVLGVFPQGVRPVREVGFSDGTLVRCDRDHLWAVRTDTHVTRGLPGEVITTDEIAGSLKQGDRWRWRVPLVAPVEHPGSEVGWPLEPYMLGVLLGDGNLTNTTPVFTSADQEVIDAVRANLPAGHRLSVADTPSAAKRCTIASGRSDRNHVTNALRALGLWGKRSEDKHVPDVYLLGTVEQRLRLLQGLMDTDGYVHRKGWCIFTTTSSGLAQGVQDLAHSLGGSTRTNNKVPTYRYKGVKREGLLAYNVTVALPDGLHQRMFTIERKRARIKRMWKPMRKIVSVHDAGEAECVCIAVEHPSHLYVTRGYVVTHNTTFAHWLLWLQARAGTPVLTTSFEQRPVGSVQKFLRMQLGGDFTQVTAAARADALEALGDMPIHVLDHYGEMPPEELMQAIRYAVRRMGVGLVLVDHLGFLLDPTGDDKVGQIESIIRALAITGYSLGVTIILVAHPKGLPQGQRRVTIADLKGSSAIKQDASDVIIVERAPPTKAKKGSNARTWPASWVHFDKVRSEFGVPGSKAMLAFGPMSCTYADSWEETPEGRSGALLVNN